MLPKFGRATLVRCRVVLDLTQRIASHRIECTTSLHVIVILLPPLYLPRPDRSRTSSQVVGARGLNRVVCGRWCASPVLMHARGWPVVTIWPAHELVWLGRDSLPSLFPF